jgi:hypothetical protein
MTQKIVPLIHSSLGEELIEKLKEHNGIISGGCMRDLILGDEAKDWDLFFIDEDDWNEFNEVLNEFEVQFHNSALGKVNVRKFSINGNDIDSIYYSHVKHLEHVADTFDFTINMLWFDPKDDTIKGSYKYSLEQIVDDVTNKRLVVNDNIWYRTAYFRAIKRYDRFREAGYTIDEENIEKYKAYLELIKPINLRVGETTDEDTFR